MKTSELTGRTLDYWVGRAEAKRGKKLNFLEFAGKPYVWDGVEDIPFEPSERWDQGGPIIEREHITTTAYMEREYCGLASGMRQPWIANIQWDYPQRCVRVWEAGPTPLIAAMRAFVCSVFGEEVDARYKEPTP